MRTNGKTSHSIDQSLSICLFIIGPCYASTLLFFVMHPALLRGTDVQPSCLPPSLRWNLSFEVRCPYPTVWKCHASGWAPPCWMGRRVKQLWCKRIRTRWTCLCPALWEVLRANIKLNTVPRRANNASCYFPPELFDRPLPALALQGESWVPFKGGKLGSSGPSQLHVFGRSP